jgi:hypothetical protein
MAGLHRGNWRSNIDAVRLSREGPVSLVTRQLGIQKRIAATREKQLRSTYAFKAGRIVSGLSGGFGKATRAISEALLLFPRLSPLLARRVLLGPHAPTYWRKWLPELLRVARFPLPEAEAPSWLRNRRGLMRNFRRAWSEMHRATISYLRFRESGDRRAGLRLFQGLPEYGLQGLITEVARGFSHRRAWDNEAEKWRAGANPPLESALSKAAPKKVASAKTHSAEPCMAFSPERLLRFLREPSPWQALTLIDGVPLRTGVLGPGWLAHALAYDAHVWWIGKADKAKTISEANVNLFLFAPPPAGRADGELNLWIREAEQVIGNPRLKAIPSVCWLSGCIPRTGRLGKLLVQVQRIYVDDRTAVAAVSRWLGKEVGHLPPAIQPLVHNPVGWWEDGSRDPRWLPRPTALWERRYESPGPIWDALVSMGRGTCVPPDGVESIARALGKRPPEANRIPPWTEKIEGRSFRDRFLRMRWVHAKHTVRSRLRTLARDAGLYGKLGIEDREPRVSVLLCTRRPHRLRKAVEAVRRQTYPAVELVLLLHGDGFREKEIAKATEGFAELQVLRAPEEWNLGRILQEATEHAAGEIFAKMDDDDMYGDEYLADQIRALRFSGASLVGKTTNAVYFSSDGMVALRFPGMEYLPLRPNWGGSFVGRTQTIREVKWRPVPTGEDTALGMDLQCLGLPLLSTDRFNAVQVRGGNPEHHAWPAKTSYILSEAIRLPETVAPEDFML